MFQELPTLRQLTRPLEEIQIQATNLAPTLSSVLTPRYVVSVVPGFSQIGSGALPVETLASACLEIKPVKAIDSELRCLIEALRALPIPVIGRLHKGGVLLDLRCLEQEADFGAQLAQLREKLF